MSQNLGEFEQLLLFAVLRLGDDAYGSSVMAEIEERTGRSVTAGAVYTGFERLARKGFVSSEFGLPSRKRGGKRKKLYRLEPAGAQALRRSLDAITHMAQDMLPRLKLLGG